MTLDVLGWADRSLGILSSTNTPSLVAYSESTVTIPVFPSASFRTDGEEDEDEQMLTLGDGKRVNESGYITNAPITLGENDYLHRIVFYSSNSTNTKFEHDPRFKLICSPLYGGQYGSDLVGRMKYQLRTGRAFQHYDHTENKYVYGEGCDIDANHYWVDETQGPFTVGCSDEEADNYTTDADYKDDELCEYTCDDPNRLVKDNGKCADCMDGYGLNDDGLCDASISTDVKLALRGLPWGIIGGGVALLAVAKFGLPLLMKK